MLINPFYCLYVIFIQLKQPAPDLQQNRDLPVNLTGQVPVSLTPAVLQFFHQFAQLLGEAVHGILEPGQQVEGHDDGKADG